MGKASKRPRILCVLKRQWSTPSDLLQIYSSLIGSVLEYCCPVWYSSLPVHLSDRIERVQKRALRVIIYPVLRYHEALITSGYTELRIRRDELCSKTFEKIKRPESRLNHLIPVTWACAHRRSLCFSDRPSLMKCRTERFKKSFFPVMCLRAHKSFSANFKFVYLTNMYGPAPFSTFSLFNFEILAFSILCNCKFSPIL